MRLSQYPDRQEPFWRNRNRGPQSPPIRARHAVNPAHRRHRPQSKQHQAYAFQARGRQAKAKFDSAGFLLRSPDAAIMGFDDRLANRKPDSHALLFGGDERLKKARRYLFRETGAGIGYRD